MRGTTSAAEDRGSDKSSWEGVVGAAIAALILLWAFVLFPYARVVTDTNAKVERATLATLELLKRRADHYGQVIAGCLSGHSITDGERVVDCAERQ